MKVIAPDYYGKFKCIADKCKHNCCKGWEIDIDDVTLRRYEKEGGALGEKLRKSIEITDNVAHFVLTEDERCPFLNSDGLCEIISALGEQALCDICTDHPRWRVFFGSHTEIGVGMACEEACRIILENREKVRYEVVSDKDFDGRNDDFQNWVIEKRGDLLKIAQDRTLDFYDREHAIIDAFGLILPRVDDFIDFVKGLERLDCAWDKMLDSDMRSDENKKLDDVTKEQILVYFIMRHVGNAENRQDFIARIAFCISSARLIERVYGNCDETVCEVCRAYSAEVEYSDDNLIDAIDYFAIVNA